MHLAVKDLFQFDERLVLIAGVAKLIFDCCYVNHSRPSWLLEFDSPPQLVIRSIKTLPKIVGLNIFYEALKWPTRGTLQMRGSIP